MYMKTNDFLQKLDSTSVAPWMIPNSWCYCLKILHGGSNPAQPRGRPTVYHYTNEASWLKTLETSV